MKRLIGVGLLALACSQGGESVKSPETETAPPPPPAAAPECVDAKDEPVTCQMDSECCQGFVCGKDPEKSQIVKYCLYAG
jgi:hypothetical protein